MFLKSCCCCYSLKTGSVVIILIVIVFQTILCIDIGVALLISDENRGLILSTVQLVTRENSNKVLEGTFLSTFFSGTAFYGIIKGKPKKIEKYLMLQVLYLALIVGALGKIFFIDPYLVTIEKSKTGSNEEFDIPTICVLVASFGVLSYFLLVVFCYYRELKRDCKPNTPTPIPLTNQSRCMTSTNAIGFV
ncbi:uncharacterized protein LOC135834690 isoform X2 [Planococcus citri]|uniref:uncharacterized protein LOC135834690 isoform X2 n=1 Tax=Planococcus citri TaxID=170843 RepID=UPI0031F97AF3